MLDTDYDYIEQERRQMIRGINVKGYPIYKKGGTHPMKILRLLFELNLFREINTYEYDLLKTCEFNNKLNDYDDLSYDERLCTREMRNTQFKQEGAKLRTSFAAPKVLPVRDRYTTLTLKQM